MHIGLSSPAWPANGSSNGIVTYVHNLRTELINQGHRVSVFAKVIGRTNQDSGIYLVEATMKHRISRKLAWLVRNGAHNVFDWGRAIATTIINVNQIYPIDILEMEESFGWCADVQKRVPIPVIVKLHGPAFLTLIDEVSQTEMGRAKIEMEGKALRQITTIISPSKSALLSTISHYQLDPMIKKVIPNPIKAASESERWDLDRCDKKLILFVGRFDKLKGGDTALIAFRRLLEQDPDLKLTFVGPDRGLTTADGPLVFFDEFMNSLFSDVQRSSVSYRGQLPRAEISDLRKKALVTLVVSRWESQGYTALEAMIQGCPIVVTDTGGLSELVEHGVTGLVARLDDIDDLCQKVMHLLNNPIMARQMGERARQFVIDRHSTRNIAQETVGVYRQAISMAKAGRA